MKLLSALGIALSMTAAGDGQGAWRPVTLADLAGTPDLARRTGPDHALHARGDFNGDGRADDAVIVRAGAADRYGVQVCFAQARGPCRPTIVTSGPAAHIATLGIRAVPRAALAAELRQPRFVARADGLDVFAFEASSTIYTWDGRRMVPRPVAD